MINSVSPSSPFAELGSDGRSPPQPAAASRPAASKSGSSSAPRSEPGKNLRLVIEFDKERNFYVYRLIDRETGNVITSIPRGQLDEMASAPDYSAGDVVSTSV